MMLANRAGDTNENICMGAPSGYEDKNKTIREGG